MKSVLTTLLLLIATFCFAERHTTIEKKIETKPNQRIELDGISGSDIKIKSWANNQVSINLRISISSSDGDYEDSYISTAKITEASSDDLLRLTFESEEQRDGGFSLFKLFRRFYVDKNISGEIYLPKKNSLTTDMRYGTVSLDDMEGELNLNGVSNTLNLRNCSDVQTIENNYGKTMIENSAGDLQLTGTSSTVSISDFDGKARVDANYSTVTMSRIQRNITVNDKSGKIKVEDAGGNISLDADYSNITIKNAPGFVDISSSSATITVENVDGINVDAKYSTVEITGVKGTSGKEIVVRGQSGSLSLVDANGDVSIINPYSNISLKDVKGNIDLSSKSSTITATGMTGDWNSRTEYCGIKLRNLKAKNVTMTNKSEGIDVRLLNVPDSVSIENEYGNVTMTMPTGFTGSVYLGTEYGSVDTNLNIKEKSRANYEFATGKLGSGKGVINIETKSSNIDLTEE